MVGRFSKPKKEKDVFSFLACKESRMAGRLRSSNQWVLQPFKKVEKENLGIEIDCFSKQGNKMYSFLKARSRKCTKPAVYDRPTNGCCSHLRRKLGFPEHYNNFLLYW